MGITSIWHRMHCDIRDRCIFTETQDGEPHHLELRKLVAFSLPLDQSLPTLMEIIRIRQRTQLLNWKCIFNEIPDGRHRHLVFQKLVAISLLFRPILTKFGRNNENLTKNATGTIKMHIYRNSRWRSPPSEFRKSVAISSLLDQLTSNLTELLGIWRRTQLLPENRILTKIRDSGRRHLEVRELVAFSVLLYQSSPKLMGIISIWHWTQVLQQKCIYT